jgi:thymidine phosphorylase
MVRLQGGRTEILEDPRRFPGAVVRQDVVSHGAGMVTDVDAEKIGRASVILGAGRSKTTDVIDPAAGLSGLAKIGDCVETGQPLVTLHAATRDCIDAALPLVAEAFVVGNGPVSAQSLVLERL